jgi:DNA mismatch repair protein MutL
VPYALLYPQKQFTLKSDGKVTFESRPASDRLTQCAKSLGLDAKALRRVVSDAPEYQLHAELILGDASIRRSKKDLQFIFVNDRPVSNRDVSAALTQVYRNILPPGSHPFFAVYITVPSDSIDVNVHPSKREIKMKHDRSIAGCIGAWAKQTLLESSGTVAYKIDDTTVLPEQTFLRPSFASIQSARPAASQERAAEYQATLKEAFADAQKHFAIGQVHDSAYEVETAENIAHIGLRQKLEHADYAGSYRKKYILFDADESLLVIDQHAAHERINFEIFLKSLQNGNIETQPLLAPLTLSLSPFEKVGLNEKIAEINTLGFDVALFDANTLAIHAHPALLRDAASAVRNLIAGSPADLRTKDKAARMACRASVMSGDRITQTESENLRKRLLACENPFTCPHGRPTVIELAESELAKQFLR